MDTCTPEARTDLSEELEAQLREIEGKLEILEAQLSLGTLAKPR